VTKAEPGAASVSEEGLMDCCAGQNLFVQTDIFVEIVQVDFRWEKSQNR
jgi:hypothetical protein